MVQLGGSAGPEAARERAAGQSTVSGNEGRRRHMVCSCFKKIVKRFAEGARSSVRLDKHPSIDIKLSVPCDIVT